VRVLCEHRNRGSVLAVKRSLNYRRYLILSTLTHKLDPSLSFVCEQGERKIHSNVPPKLSLTARRRRLIPGSLFGGGLWKQERKEGLDRSPKSRTCPSDAPSCRRNTMSANRLSPRSEPWVLHREMCCTILRRNLDFNSGGTSQSEGCAANHVLTNSTFLIDAKSDCQNVHHVYSDNLLVLASYLIQSVTEPSLCAPAPTWRHPGRRYVVKKCFHELFIQRRIIHKTLVVQHSCRRTRHQLTRPET
jgi:hypothetical protein